MEVEEISVIDFMILLITTRSIHAIIIPIHIQLIRIIAQVSLIVILEEHVATLTVEGVGNNCSTFLTGICRLQKNIWVFLSL